MTLKLQPNPTFTAAVALSVPGQDKPAKITVTFKHLARPQIRDFFGNLEGKTDLDALGAIISGWSGIDEPFSEESLALLLDNYPAAAGELFEAFRRELLEARAKN
jgi:hypothetical protein